MPGWRRTLYILFAAQLLSGVGFAVFFPFLPLYVAELGTRTSLSIEFWSGLVYAGQALTMAIFAPIWGSLADRFGRKPMVERAMYGGALIIGLMGFARSAEELALLRALQGVITGTIAAANALAAADTPRERMGYAMGLLQVANWAGVAAGPLLGGLLADTLGFRTPFLLTAALLTIAGLVVTLGVRERFTRPAPGARRAGILADWRRILASAGVAAAFVVRFLTWLGTTMLLPILPLFIQSLLAGSGRVSTFTGLVVGASSAAGTASALYLGRLGDRLGHRQVVIAAMLLGALCYAPQFFVTAGWQLLLLQALTGAAIGGAGPSLSALLMQYTRAGDEGAVYGLDNSVSSGARSLAPLVGAAVAVWAGPPGVFLASAAALLLAGLIALRFLPRAAPARAARESLKA